MRKHFKNLTYISLSITLSILYQHCHSLTRLWCCVFLQPAFGLHTIAGKVRFKKKKRSCQLATLSLHLSSLYQLVQVIITLTAFSVFTLSLNLSSRGACCANQLHRAPVTSICSARLHTGTDWRMQAKLPLQLSLPRQLSFTELSVVWLAACQRLHTPPSPSAFSPPRVEATTRLRESRHDVWATVPRPRDISCGWYCDIFYDWMHVVSHDPSKKICGDGVNAMVLMPTTRPC